MAWVCRVYRLRRFSAINVVALKRVSRNVQVHVGAANARNLGQTRSRLALELLAHRRRGHASLPANKTMFSKQWLFYRNCLSNRLRDNVNKYCHFKQTFSQRRVRSNSLCS